VAHPSAAASTAQVARICRSGLAQKANRLPARASATARCQSLHCAGSLVPPSDWISVQARSISIVARRFSGSRSLNWASYSRIASKACASLSVGSIDASSHGGFRWHPHIPADRVHGHVKVLAGGQEKSSRW